MSGRVSYLGGIVKDGLILDLDAGKLDSYNRLGTTWNDVSGNRNNGTLINFSNPSPQTIWNSNNGGSVIFDGTNDYMDFGILSSINNLTTFTVDFWFKTNNAATEQFFISTTNAAGTKGWHVEMFNNKVVLQVYPLTYYRQSNTILSSNVWYHVSVTYLSSTNVLIYINGAVTSTTDTGGSTFTFTASDYNTLFSYYAPGVSSKLPFNGNLAGLKLYNRGLSASEVSQNYNTLKGRYI